MEGALRSGWQAAAVGYTVSLVAGALAGVWPQSSFLNALTFFGLAYFLYGLWRVAKASGRSEVFSLNLWATLIEFSSMVLFGLSLIPMVGATGFQPAAGPVLLALLAYAGFVYGVYLEMKGLTALAEVGRVPLLAKAARWVFLGALLLPVLVGLLLMLGGYLAVAVALWQGPKLEPDAGS